MTGNEASRRFGSVTIYKLMRKTGRLRARDLIPPAVAIPPADLAIIESTGANVASIIAKTRADSMRLRVAGWWDEVAGPFMRRLQAAMLVRLEAHVARRQQAMWSNHKWTLKVQGERDRDAYTGRVLVNSDGETVN